MDLALVAQRVRTTVAGVYIRMAIFPELRSTPTHTHTHHSVVLL
jgi:hypothetical protein